MQSVSTTFSPFADARFCNMRVSFRLIDNTAQADATPTATNYNTDLSQLAQTIDLTEKASKKWATLETNGWPLDGSCYILPDSITGQQTGWWSGISGADGNFATPPTLIFNFASAHSSVGFTVFFDDKANQYPKSMTITAYNASNAVISTQTVTCTGVKQVVEMPVANYRKVILSFGGTQEPYQSVRVSEVVFGIVKEFSKDNMTQGEVLYEVNPTSEALPTGQLTLNIDNSEKDYNMLSPNSLFSYLQQSQPLDVELGIGTSKGSIEYVNAGRFYYAKSEAEDNSMTATITAYDRIYQLDKGTYRKGTNSTASVTTLINAVLTDANIGLTASIPTAIASRVIGSCIPLVSHREAIRMICQAARCVAYINRDNVLVLADLAVGTSVDALDGNNMVSYPQISVSDRVNTANVSIFTVNNASASTENIYKAVMAISGTVNVWVEFTDAASSPSAAVSGGTLNSATYYLYGALLNITASGDVTITVTGYKMSAFESVYTATNIQSSETVQALKIQNKLITTSAIASAVASWALAFSRVTYNINERGNPARELLDTSTISDTYGVNGDAAIIREQYTFNGGLSCQTKAVK